MTAFVGMETCLICLEKIKETELLFLRNALVTGLCVNYAKSFEPAFDAEEGKTQSFRTRNIEGFDRKVHDDLLRMRDKYVAHAGHGVNDYQISFLEINGSADLVNSDGKVGEIKLKHALGSSGRASIAIGFDDISIERIKRHAYSLRVAAGNELIHAILDHQNVLFQRKLITGEIAHPSDNGAPVLGDIQFLEESHKDEEPENWKTVFKYSDDQFLSISPSDLQELSIEFIGIHFRIYQNGPETVSLQMMVRPRRVPPTTA